MGKGVGRTRGRRGIGEKSEVGFCVVDNRDFDCQKKNIYTLLQSLYAVAVALGLAVSSAFSLGIFTLIASSLTFAGPLSCPLGTPGNLEFLLFPLAPGPEMIFF